jgi:hypothetical protein
MCKLCWVNFFCFWCHLFCFRNKWIKKSRLKAALINGLINFQKRLSYRPYVSLHQLFFRTYLQHQHDTLRSFLTWIPYDPLVGDHDMNRMQLVYHQAYSKLAGNYFLQSYRRSKQSDIAKLIC